MSRFYSTKTYGNEVGLSCCFRQWKATHSHCSKLHGYSLGVRLVFECQTLDDRGWVQDFGGLKPVKKWLQETFDHTVLIAVDDPCLSDFKRLDERGLINLRIVECVGCESFARLICNQVNKILGETEQLNSTARIYSVEVFEHGANSATYVNA